MIRSIIEIVEQNSNIYLKTVKFPLCVKNELLYFSSQYLYIFGPDLINRGKIISPTVLQTTKIKGNRSMYCVLSTLCLSKLMLNCFLMSNTLLSLQRSHHHHIRNRDPPNRCSRLPSVNTGFFTNRRPFLNQFHTILFTFH